MKTIYKYLRSRILEQKLFVVFYLNSEKFEDNSIGFKLYHPGSKAVQIEGRITTDDVIKVD